jgi:ribosomal protein L7/L12
MSALSANQELEIKELVTKGNKIAAVKLYREITGAGLKESKDAVESIERGVPIQIPSPAQTGDPDPFLEIQIKRLLAERKKIEAVKAYREAYNCGLKEAKDAVDDIEIQMRTGGYSSMPSAPVISNDPFAEDEQRNRRFMALVLAIVVIVIGGIAFLFWAGNGF